jgi:hypothetical protein
MNTRQRRDIERLTRNGMYKWRVTRKHSDGDITVRIYKGNITQRYIIDVSGHVFQETVYRGHPNIK